MVYWLVGSCRYRNYPRGTTDKGIYPMETVTPDHFRLAPSSCFRWLRCPGSAQYNLPDQENEAARRGSIGHALVLMTFTGGPLPQDLEADFTAMSKADRDELEDAVDWCFDFVDQILPDYDSIQLESKIASKLIPEHGGTIDFLGINQTTLQVIDYKFGNSRVDPRDNKQLMSYLNLARERHHGCTRFLGTILQPVYPDATQTIEFSVEELDLHFLACLDASMRTDFYAGDHCKYCPLLLTCETAAVAVRADVDSFPILATKLLSDTGDPSPEDVAKLERMYDLGKAGRSMEEQAKEMLLGYAKRGVGLVAHKFVKRAGWRRWRPGADEILTKRFPELDLYEPGKLITPAKAQKALGMKPKEFESLELSMPGPPSIILVSSDAAGDSVSFGVDEFEVIE